MCLDISYLHGNQKKMEISTEEELNGDEIIVNPDAISDVPIKCLCGGNLLEYPPVFDPKAEIIYVVRKDKVRLFSVETGEFIRDIDDNKDGAIIGLSVDPESKKSLIACTTNGTVISWKLESFVISSKLKLNLSMPVKVTRFIVTTIGGEAYGTVCFKDQNQHFQLAVVELKKGKVVQRYQIPFINEKKGLQVRLADGCARSKYFVAVQKQMIYVIDKTSSNFIAHQNAAPINVVACHPEEEMIATGDVTGRIRLWREIFSKEPIKDELHWHHQIVLSLAFSQSGTILYSGGVECVLVKWDVKNKFIDKDFLPRLPGSIKQISVDAKHDTLTLSLDDNSIQIINSGLAQLKSIQDFTQASLYDLGMSDPFPAGIVMNPRHLVMNGRIGHLQFFSTKTMKLLFNIDIAARNSVPRSKKVNIFSTQITRVALSVKWMVTVESWNDRINSPDSRLKFWKFKDDQQTYALHTQIEQAHEKEIHCIEFSTMNDSRAIICATAGLDHCIKIWSLEKSEEVKGAKKIWLCIEQLGYKNLPLKHLSFSQDSSLIAAGFGNCLCVWDTTKFSLKCALSAAATNGSVNRVMFSLPSLPSKKSGKSTQPAITSALEKRRNIIDLMMSVISGKDSEALVKNITQPKKRQFEQEPMKKENSRNLSKAEKEQIFKRVLSIPDIKFKQKIEILHKLNIYYKISNQVEQEVVDFINRIAIENQDLYRSFHRKLKTIRKDDKFRIQWRFRTWNMLTSKHNRNRITVRKLLTYKIDDELLERKKAKEKANESFVPIKNLAHITNVIFCTEDLSHLVIATTSERLLVWDLLTLKLQGSFKLHIKFVSLDPLTNLVAAFTKYNELFIFNPSPAMTLHSQRNIPEIYGAVWVPRATPKAQTLNVNWQATSQLLFLTKSQEVCCFKLPYDDDYGHGATLTYLSNGFKSHTPFAAMMAQEITDGTTKHAFGETKQIAVIRTGAVKDIVNMSAHAMPPVRLLSQAFIASMLSSSENKLKLQRRESEETVETMIISDDENELTPIHEKIIRRKALEKEEKAMKEEGAKKKETVTNIENRMKSLKLETLKDFGLQ